MCTPLIHGDSPKLVGVLQVNVVFVRIAISMCAWKVLHDTIVFDDEQLHQLRLCAMLLLGCGLISRETAKLKS